jgi:type 1 glutamine amidotransferase
MGKDHPLVWWHEVGEGQVFYSALGHTTETYQESHFRKFMRGAIVWGLSEAEKKKFGDKRSGHKRATLDWCQFRSKGFKI